jgi:hypothetical protein
MEWRGVGDKPTKKREARLLTKGEQLPYSGCVKALPLAYSRPMSMGKIGGQDKIIWANSQMGGDVFSALRFNVFYPPLCFPFFPSV